MTLDSRFCSWCHQSAPQTLFKTNRLARNIYECSHCQGRTLVCVIPNCQHMARAGEYWDDNLCAEHDGSVPNLATFGKELEDIEHFSEVMRRESRDFLEMPELIPGKLGRLLPIPKNDFSALEHFEIRRTQEGGKEHAVIFVNGFLSQGERDISDWTGTTKRYFGKATQYHLDWEATGHPVKALGDSVRRFPAPVISRTVSNVLAHTGLDALASWHLSMKNAEIAGRLLAEAIMRTPGWRFTLAGHSLGARVVHFALTRLAEQPRKRIDNAYLLGAAVGGGAKDDECWSKASDAVRGRIFNCYSHRDGVLANLYRGANLGMSKPAGYRGIHLEHDKLVNLDCTDVVDSHAAWKPQFGEVIRLLRQRA